MYHTGESCPFYLLGKAGRQTATAWGARGHHLQRMFCKTKPPATTNLRNLQRILCPFHPAGPVVPKAAVRFLCYSACRQGEQPELLMRQCLALLH